MSNYLKDKYDVVIIGASIGGLSAALELLDQNLSILVLERSHTPGGVAASFVRNGYEMELAMHEICSVGSEKAPLGVRQFLSKHDIPIKWIKNPECYRLVSKKDDIDITLHSGSETFAREIDTQYPGTYNEVRRFLSLAYDVYSLCSNVTSPEFTQGTPTRIYNAVKTLTMTTDEVMDTFNLPSAVKKILIAYWFYCGTPTSKLPFSMYAILIGDYILHGSYISSCFSSEIGERLLDRVREKGAIVEFNQPVSNILVKDKKVTGIRLNNGEVIRCDYVISGAYPNNVYGKMVEPLSEVPTEAVKYINAMPVGLTSFTVNLILEHRPKTNGFKNYETFISLDEMNTDKLMESLSRKEHFNWLCVTCLNYSNPHVCVKHTTNVQICSLIDVSVFKDVKVEEYEDLKNKLANELIEAVEETLDVSIKDRIIDVVISTPVSVSLYSNSYLGSIYGYQHTMTDHVIARFLQANQEEQIDGLYFANATCSVGNGMSTQIVNAKNTTKKIADRLKPNPIVEMVEKVTKKNGGHKGSK